MAAKRHLNYAQVLELAAIARPATTTGARLSVLATWVEREDEPRWRDSVAQIAAVAEAVARSLEIERPVAG
ncbi:MAG: hypothetical protein K2Q23_01560 [Bryobacteraceae bacterium]|nr:hypothetical protein [Bryobacteraceae bacterium]